MKLADTSDCIEVMTGTALPENADTVVPYEDLKIEDGIAYHVSGSITPRQNIHRQGSDALKDEHLLSPGLILSAAEIALLASVGKNNVRVLSFPSTAIVSSGDEIVSVETIPAAHQVRRSNAIAIQAAMRIMGWAGTIFHLPDLKEQMTIMMREIASQFDVIILSGGVSKGKFDFVPAVMEEIGVAKIFHRVNQRPGKPFWFGASSRGHIVFALPGNPVSTYLCFYRYIKPWMLKSMGVANTQAKAVLAEDFRAPQGLTYFLQVNVINEEGKLMAYPDPGGGSGDFANLKRVSGFLELPEDRSLFSKGEVLPYFSFRTDN